jgi:hypothetical protein
MMAAPVQCMGSLEVALATFDGGDCAPDKLVVGSVRFAIIVVPRRSSQGGEEILAVYGR